MIYLDQRSAGYENFIYLLDYMYSFIHVCIFSHLYNLYIPQLDTNTDEDFLIQTFKILGEPLCAVKVIRKNTE